MDEQDLTADFTSADDEEAPDFTDWERPDALLTSGPIRERLLDVLVQLHSPATVATIADRADCDTETAREYLDWFETMGVVREHPGRPVRYDRNESYLRWRRVERIRQNRTDEEIVEVLAANLEKIDSYRAAYGVESPDEVSLVDSDHDGSVEDIWADLSDWKTLEQRVDLLDSARRGSTDLAPGRESIDA